jgi:hypothetical protein
MSPDATGARTEPIRLSVSEGRDRKVLVEPAAEDKGRFILSVEKAIRACQVADTQLRFAEDFRNELLPRLAVWVRERRGRVASAYLTVREDGLLFVVVQASRHYDGQLEDELTALDVEIARHPTLKRMQLDVLALPEVSEEAYQSFLDPEHTLAYGAKRS